jgi:hypothetical protein
VDQQPPAGAPPLFTATVGLKWGRLEAVGPATDDGEAVDALALGRYLGSRSSQTELGLDQAVTRTVRGLAADAPVRDADLVLNGFAERGVFRGELARPFLVPDPRPGMNGRVIALVGMGVPGRFGVSELTVLARELCWTLGRLGKRHLATVLIGAGAGNLPVGDAVLAWLHGLSLAAAGAVELSLRRLTFIESDPRRIDLIRDAVKEQEGRPADGDVPDGVAFRYVDAGEGDPAARARESERLEIEDWRRWRDAQKDPAGAAQTEPVRLTVELAPKAQTTNADLWSYRFGLLTPDASVPEREVLLNRTLVMEANSELYNEGDTSAMYGRGMLMQLLLLPADLRRQFMTTAPVVLQLNPDAAAIHWELLAQPELPRLGDSGDGRPAAARFLGTARGVTRQLRTTVAPTPAPPLPPHRRLRVLVVANPAPRSKPLPNAEKEGRQVAAMFQNFSKVRATDKRVEVVLLCGTDRGAEATRTNVLRLAMTQPFDVLHFAGHCEFNPDPSLSGWRFDTGLLTTNELTRVDRVPRFVFSNACFSGEMADLDTGKRSAQSQMVPSFAEAFFARGVSNLVCTAWDVDDALACEFALSLYERLLGVRRADGDPGLKTEGVPLPMYAAMCAARLAISTQPAGIHSWGSYQHYGNPNFRMLDERDPGPAVEFAVKADVATKNNAVAPAPDADATPKRRGGRATK